MKANKKRILSRGSMTLLLIEIIVVISILIFLSNYYFQGYIIFRITSIYIFICIFLNKNSIYYKLAWALPLIVSPVWGTFLYIFWGKKYSAKEYFRNLIEIQKSNSFFIKQDPRVIEELLKKDRLVASEAIYINEYSFSPIYKNTKTEYLSPGDMKFKKLLEELKKAERYIFLEYFIIELGEVWDSILKVLVEKAKEGVEIRLIYDDIGCLDSIPYEYPEFLKNNGIDSISFNRFKPVLTTKHNNRDHRKIVVIDGIVAITGGINLADDYVSIKGNLGYWKDASILLKGDASWKFTVMFLDNWGFITGKVEDYNKYRPRVKELIKSDGFVQGYGDIPYDDETTGKLAYINMINKASKYVYIVTPYLILDNEMIMALTLAAKSGVEVAIITPSVSDSKMAQKVTRSFYPTLIEGGVKIYEYGLGFIHSKIMVADNKVAIIGTINMDYRSFYSNLECAVFLAYNETIIDIKEDFIASLSQCERITVKDLGAFKLFNEAINNILAIFSPLM